MYTDRLKLGDMVRISFPPEDDEDLEDEKPYVENMWEINDAGPVYYVADFKDSDYGIVVQKTRTLNQRTYVKVITSAGNSGWIREHLLEKVDEKT